MSSPNVRPDIAVIAIGRNEGQRLHDCLDSVRSRSALVVYVDSGSTDDSVAAAKARGAVVVNLDMSLPFTAARARNAGFERVKELAPDVEWVQFVDGDCKVAPEWLDTAVAFLQAHPDVVAVAGRRRERFPERSVYNWLCDLDWNQPPGAVRAFGGDVLIRAAALEQVGGYRDDLIAGEEPELCLRLRARGWHIWRIDAEMTWHDAAMTHFRQWWQRTTRAGFAFAEGAHLHGAPPERHWVRETRSGWIWGVVIPALVLAGVLAIGPIALLGLLIYPAQVLRLSTPSYGSWSRRITHAFFVVLGKFPQALGQLKFVVLQLLGRKSKLIEYK